MVCFLYKGHHFVLGTLLLICTLFASYVMYIVGSFQIVQYQAESTVNQELNTGKVNKRALNDTYTRQYLADHKKFKAKIDGEVDYYNKNFAGAFRVNNKVADITVKSVNGSFHIDKLKIYKKN
ncbi:hypothetical protein [Apilactobacillus timberlakei]|uniref:hypothetical protein n=1 Tax=Apilactobacillus timberlakei TaxID=2008380 RepID=UPI0011297E65|nr:hypothetical protein [Apilactobacillus timberlakei]